MRRVAGGRGSEYPDDYGDDYPDEETERYGNGQRSEGFDDMGDTFK